MRVPAGAVIVAYVGNGLVWQCARVEYSPGISPSAAVDPIAVTAVRVVGQWKHDRTLRIELDYNTPVFSSQFFSSDGMGYVHWHHLPRLV